MNYIFFFTIFHDKYLNFAGDSYSIHETTIIWWVIYAPRFNSRSLKKIFIYGHF